MNSVSRWEHIYNQVPLCDMPRHFAGIQHSPFLLNYLKTTLRHCPSGGRTCEIGIGSGSNAVWLSLRGIQAEGIDNAPGIVERARQVNNMLDGHAAFRCGDMFEFYASCQAARKHYHVVHHQGLLEHFSVPWIRAALAQQVACADWVVFSVPSVYYPFDPEFGDERLLPLEEWQRILSPFAVEDLQYYGDPQFEEREHIQGILRGQTVDDALLALMTVPAEPYSEGISAIVHTRNESRHIAACLETLQGWTDEVIVCDMESEDDTVEIAERFTDQVIPHPRIANFDRARNVSAMRANYRWVFYLDADERVPPGLGAALREIIASQGEEFCGLLLPFRHHFAGQWMQCLYPGYTAPRLFKNGRFFFNPRLHAGAQVEGRLICFPADNPDLALVHYSFDSLAHYLDKLNRYTDGEAVNMHRDGQSFHWQRAVRHFVQDFQSYYAQGAAAKDGVHGFLYAFLSGFYRFEQHAKLYEQRWRRKELQAAETAVPHSVEEMLEYALSVVREKPLLQVPEIRIASRQESPLVTVATVNPKEHVNENETPDISKPLDARSAIPSSVCKTPASPSPQDQETKQGVEGVGQGVDQGEDQRADVVWSGPLRDPSGYGEESRHFLFGLVEAGTRIAAQSLPWSHDEVDLAASEHQLLEELTRLAVRPGFVQITQNFPPGFRRQPQAGVAIGRTMFETDRLPPEWVRACNQMDYIWVPSEFNRQTFAQAGVEERKLVVIPGCFDPQPFLSEVPIAASGSADVSLADDDSADRRRLLEEMAAPDRFTFLSIFDWTRHKGWDVLLRAFVEEFQDRNDVLLVFKVWSTMGYDAESLREQAHEFAARELGHDLPSDMRIRFVTERWSRAELHVFYQVCDAFVLPSRGEGWGRPYMEAMACGKPTIGTGWSGNTAFMNNENSFLVDYQLQPVPEIGWREIPTYRGHRWAEPDVGHLRALMRYIHEHRAEAAIKGARGRQEVSTRFDRKVVGRQIARELDRVQQEISRSGTAGRPWKQSKDDSALVTQQFIGHLTERTVGQEVVTADEGVTAADEVTQAPVLILPPDYVPQWRPTAELMRVRWEGTFWEWHSLAHVNRELGRELMRSGQVELSLVPPTSPHFDPALEPAFRALSERDFAPLSGTADVHVRHSFPPRLNRPAEGRFVLIQPWEYGYLPTAWIEAIQQNVDEVWCYSRYVRDVYTASGIPEEKLQIVPLGVDTDVFNPQAPPYVFTTEAGAARIANDQANQDEQASERQGNEKPKGNEKPIRPVAPEKTERASDDGNRFTFLFAGGTLQRKGIDILLEAYLKAFSAYDEVCLIIKDTGTQTVYRGQNERERIVQLAQDETRPPIIYVDTDLSSHQLAGVYTAADCLVQPYRGEGFCLPALEAMACGLPVIVPVGGPTDDFVDETVGWRIAAQRRPFQVSAQGRGHIGEWECAGPTWMLEVSSDALARLMRQVVGQRGEVRRRGLAAATRVQEKWTWQCTAEKALQRLAVLKVQDKPKSLPLKSVPAVSAGADLWFPQGFPKAIATARPIADFAGTPGAESIRPRAPVSISLCMIVRDEERVLGDCLRSVRPWVDEIIVVDTGSTDGTVAIAQSHGARVSRFPWCDDFSAARNESLAHATGDWIFWMDADDTIPEECGRQLRELVAFAEERTTGFLMQVRIPPAPGEHGFTVVDHVKLFRNRPQLRFEGRIHEQILEPIYRHGGRIERTDLHVVHSGYDYSPAGQQKKRERDLQLLQKDLEDRPDHPFVLFNIGMTAYHLKEYDKALSSLEKCLARCKPRESIVRKVYAMLAGCHLEQGRTQDALEQVEKGLAEFPRDPELLFRAGIIYRAAGDLEAAEHSYQKLLSSHEQGHIDSLDISITGYKARHNLALIYQDRGRWEEAERQWRIALAEQPNFMPSWTGLTQMFIQLRRFDDARSLIQEVIPLSSAQAEQLEARLAAATRAGH